jgi:hypothetical protein
MFDSSFVDASLEKSPRRTSKLDRWLVVTSHPELVGVFVQISFPLIDLPF